jgi:hypothetical protein
MLRSCYTTEARFYNGHAQTDDIEWFFVDDVPSPFLPIPSVINSLNWVPRRGETDSPTKAGEKFGAPRTYAKGNRPARMRGLGYCGTSTDWLGNGTRPPSPVPLGPDGQPMCCPGLVPLTLSEFVEIALPTSQIFY